MIYGDKDLLAKHGNMEIYLVLISMVGIEEITGHLDYIA